MCIKNALGSINCFEQKENKTIMQYICIMYIYTCKLKKPGDTAAKIDRYRLRLITIQRQCLRIICSVWSELKNDLQCTALLGKHKMLFYSDVLML